MQIPVSEYIRTKLQRKRFHGLADQFHRVNRRFSLILKHSTIQENIMYIYIYISTKTELKKQVSPNVSQAKSLFQSVTLLPTEKNALHHFQKGTSKC